MGVWVCGCVGVWVCGCVGDLKKTLAYSQDCAAAWWNKLYNGFPHIQNLRRDRGGPKQLAPRFSKEPSDAHNSANVGSDSAASATP